MEVYYRSRSERQMEEARQRYVEGKLSLEGLEAELDFWMQVEECDWCRDDVPGGSLCTSHYGQLVGR